MAEENKSWFPNIGLLSDSSLQGLTPEVQDQLQRESTKRIFLGAILSGGNFGQAFQSAVGVPTDYFARQQQIVAQNQLANVGRAAAASSMPTTMGVSPGSAQAQMLEQDIKDFGPDAARTANALFSNPNLPREINKPLYAKNVSQVLAATSPKDWAEFEKNVRPQAMEPGSVITDAFNPTKVISQLPGGLEKGMQWGVNPVTGKPEVQLMPGFATGIAERTAAEKGAAAQYDFEKVKGPDGTTYYVPKSVLGGYSQQPAATPKPAAPQAPARPSGAAGQPPQIPGFVPGVDIAPNKNPLVSQFVAEQAAPEVAYQEGWKKINDDAYAGYKQASKNSSQIGTLQNIFNRPDFDTNAFTGYKTQLTSVLNAMGVANEKQKDFLNNATSARRAINDFAVNNVSELSGATSDRDIQFSKERFVTLTDPKQSNQYALDLIAASDARKKQFYNFVQGNRTPDVIQKWENSEQGKTSIFESPTMRKYLPSSTVSDGPYKGQTAYRMPDGTVKVFPK